MKFKKLYTVCVINWNNLFLQIVKKYMYKGCPCNSLYLCHPKTCKLFLPRMDDVAMTLKMKYEQSLYSMIIPSSTQQHVSVVERKNQQRVHPENMIYFNRSPDYCTANPAYNIGGIAGRECTLNNHSSSRHCDNLCCDHGYETFPYTAKRLCNCIFYWGFYFRCDTCYVPEIRHKCLDPRPRPEVSITSYINTITNATVID